MILTNPLKAGAIALATALIFGSPSAVLAAPGGSSTDSDGVTIRRNPDGTVDVYESSSGSTGATAAGSTANSTARSNAVPKARKSASPRAGSTRYSDGVMVRKNPDGSIETYDVSDAPVRTSGARGKTAAPRAGLTRYSDVTVKRNPDGTVETYDAVAAPSVLKKAAPRVQSGKRSAPKARAKNAPKARGSYGGVRVKRYPDGTIETFDSD